MKKSVLLIALILFCITFGKVTHFAKKGFNLRRIQPWETGLSIPFDEESEKALSQNFYFLGRGRQCFAFESEDKKYVLKIPRTDSYKVPFYIRALSLAQHQKLKREQNQAFFLESLRISFEELKDYSALLAIHLGPTKSSGKKLRLKDPLGIPFQLPLDKTSFLLQKKVPILTTCLQEALQKGDRNQVEKILTSWVSAVRERGQRQVMNKDEAFLDNFGFDGEKVYQIDIGSYYKIPEMPPEILTQKSLIDTMRPIEEWLTKLNPEIGEFLKSIL